MRRKRKRGGTMTTTTTTDHAFELMHGTGVLTQGKNDVHVTCHVDDAKG